MSVSIDRVKLSSLLQSIIAVSGFTSIHVGSSDPSISDEANLWVTETGGTGGTLTARFDSALATPSILYWASGDRQTKNIKILIPQGHRLELTNTSGTFNAWGYVNRIYNKVNKPNIALLAHFNGTNGSTTFTDSSVTEKKTFYVGAGSPTISTAQSVFGGASLRLPGTNANIKVGATLDSGTSDFNFGIDDFTIEFRFRADSIGTNATLVDTNEAGSTLGIQINLDTSTVKVRHNGTNILTSGSLSSNTFYCVTVGREAGITYLYIDGVLQGTVDRSSINYIRIAKAFTIGALYNNTSMLTGYFDEFIVYNNYSLRDGVNNFTVPVAPYDDP